MADVSHAEALQFPVLIGDIGGTNARFAVVSSADDTPVVFPTVPTSSFATIDDAIQATVLDTGSLKPKSAVLAIAGPVDGDEIPLTNCPWVIRPKVMAKRLGLEDIIILNDFEAQALGVLALAESDFEKVGDGTPEKDAPRVVLGPGTGLGVAGLIQYRGVWLPVAGEGGHMDIGPRTPRDFEVFPHIERLEGRISGEQILCGRGLVNVYRAICAADGKQPVFSKPQEISSAGLAKTDAAAEEAIDLFTICLGRTAGDLALVFKSRGGVFLTGGIAQKILPALKTGKLRDAFNDKAPHSAMMRSIPIFVMKHPLGALMGIAAYAQRPGSFGIVTTGRRWRS